MPMIGSGRVARATTPLAPSSPKKKQKMRLQAQEEIEDFVKSAHAAVMEQWHQKQANLLNKHLVISRDAVLARADKSVQRTFPRLLSNADDSPQILKSLLCQPCAIAPASSVTANERRAMSGNQKDDVSDNSLSQDDEPKARNGALFTVKMRVDKGHRNVSLGPPLYLEGSHSPRPKSSATIFLKTHYATEDEQNLKYVPYFGDDDKDDVVSDLYNLEDREKQMEFGPEYRERATNDILDDVLLLLQKRLQENNVESTPELNREFHTILAEIMDEYLDRIHERYELVISKTKAAPPAPPAKPTKHERKLEDYLDAMDTYRPIFCRRCFIYDCNIHGNLGKASLELQGELAVQRERDGFWNQPEETNATDDDDEKKPSAIENSSSDDNYLSCEELEENLSESPEQGISIVTVPGKEIGDGGTADDLTPLQKAICERTFLIFQGDTKKMAITMGASSDAVADYCRLKGLKLEEFKHLKEEHVQMFKNKKRKKGSGSLWQSMNNYNPTWLKRVEDSEIHPVFVPCDHDEPCSEESCSCVRNAFFCTKHCAWERRSRNFFRGCACNGRCMTKTCSCFAAKRECDPDLCKACGACTDPPNQPATTQRCLNDQIGMRRHCHLLLGKSSIEDAGWGIYTRHALKKGDYVHEYVGEVISQEEAERRGRIYDKVNRSYLFNLSSDFVVDASRKGNKSRFANHSNKPNCYTKMVDVNGDIRIGLYAREDIEPQTELFFDYRYDVAMDNDLIIKPGMTVDWMKNPKMANKISKKYA
ncbi:hypothetical protein MHU86_1777 [Fragilaria crotonensis]|nr:hypothetical protein MHU86_1777 [Fragilaria crotonensis]